MGWQMIDSYFLLGRIRYSHEVGNMLLVNSAKANVIKSKLDGASIEGITYHVVKTEGLMLHVSHDAENDDVALKTVKKFIKEMPEMTGMFLNIRIQDENGNIR